MFIIFMCNSFVATALTQNSSFCQIVSTLQRGRLDEIANYNLHDYHYS